MARLNHLAFYSNPDSNTYALFMLPTNGLTWGKTGRGADDVSNLLLYNSRPLTVLVLGELDRTFLSAWNGGPSARVGIVI